LLSIDHGGGPLALVGVLAVELAGSVAGSAWAGVAIGLVGWVWLMRRPRGGEAHLIRERMGTS
jgi:hypothetical protein